MVTLPPNEDLTPHVGVPVAAEPKMQFSLAVAA
jgi:hypothetical protein